MKAISRLMLLLLVVMATLAMGCAESNPVSTGFSSDGGYAINLSATAKSVPFGGSIVFSAVVRDGNGDAVMSSPHSVTFTTTQGGKFTPLQAPISNGIAQAIYVAPQYSSTAASLRAELADDADVPAIDSLPTPTGVTSDIPRSEVVTASFMGAAAKLTINVYRP